MEKKDSLEEENILIKKYDLKDINNDNDIEEDIELIKPNKNDENNSKENSITNIKKNSKLNYSKIIGDALENINCNSKEKKSEDEFKINLLLLSSLNDINIKSICLYLIFKINENQKNFLLANNILNKINKYQEKNKNLNYILANILISCSQLFYEKKNFFYAYHFIKKAKNLSVRQTNENNSEKMKSLFSKIIEALKKYINSKYELFKDKNKMTEKKLDSINKVLSDILIQEKKIINSDKINNNIEDDEYVGSYLFAINKDWVLKTKVFIDYYKIYTNEMMDDNFLQNAFDAQNILNSYFNELNNSENNYFMSLYPGPINNYNLLKYKDFWEDSINEEENFFIKNNLILNKDYYLISQRNWNILNEIFDSTNEIKIKENNIGYIVLRPLILEKRLRNNKNLLKRRTIQIKKNYNIKKLKEKILRCISYELKKINKDNLNYYDIDEQDEYEEMERMKKDSNISFYIIEKENKNILVEINIAFTNNFHLYNSNIIKEIKLSEEDSINSLFNIYDKIKHILIIEIGEKNYDNFLQEFKPIIKKDIQNNNKELIYQCNICENEINIKNKYDCEICNFSFFCSKTCLKVSPDHIKLHKLYTPLLKVDFNLELLTKKNISFKSTSNEGIVGLFNLGNTCYLNSTIQCLSNTIELTRYFLLDFYKNENNFMNFNQETDIIEEYANLIKTLWLENDQVVSPRKFRIAFGRLNKQFAGNMEQDAHEFLSCLLNNLHDRLNRATSKPDFIEIGEKRDNETEIEAIQRWEKYEKLKNDSIIYDLFNGQFMSCIICQKCGKNSTTFEQFNILSLPIPSNHFLLNIKYFTDKECKYFPFAVNDNSTFVDLKEKALLYYKNDLMQNILRSSDGDFYNILNEEKNNIIYNYNNTNFPKYIFYKYLDIIILNKTKLISDNINIKDDEKILPFINKKDYEIVLYEKKSISKNYINIYLTASSFSNDNYFFFKKRSINNYSYPVLLSFENNLSLDNLNQTLKNKFKTILNPNKNNINDFNNENQNNTNLSSDDLIKIIIWHFKNNSPCIFCKKTLEESKFCLLEDLLNKKYTLKEFGEGFNDSPIILAANSNYFEVDKKCFINNVLYLNPEIEEKNENENINIYDCLEKFREEEILDNENKWFCQNCKMQQNAKKKIQIFKSPPYLIIQLKRFKYKNNILYKILDRTKIDTFVEIPKILNLKEYIEGPDKNNSIYELYGDIVHLGSHYVAVCKNRQNWILYNDDSCYNHSFPKTKNSYLLFYKKIT